MPSIIETMLYHCFGCGEDKPRIEFGDHKGKRDNRRSQCKVCVRAKTAKHKAENRDMVNAQNARYRLENREEIAKRNKQRREENHEYFLKVEAEYRNINRDRILANHRSWSEANADHLREWNATYRAANHERLAEYRRDWFKAHPGYLALKSHQRRATLAGVESDGSTRDDVWLKDGGICHLCYTSLPEEARHDTDAWHCDHMHPLKPQDGSEPGSDTLDNKAVACKSCNLRKKNRIILSGAFA